MVDPFESATARALRLHLEEQRRNRLDALLEPGYVAEARRAAAREAEARRVWVELGHPFELDWQRSFGKAVEELEKRKQLLRQAGFDEDVRAGALRSAVEDLRRNQALYDQIMGPAERARRLVGGDDVRTRVAARAADDLDRIRAMTEAGAFPREILPASRDRNGSLYGIGPHVPRPIESDPYRRTFESALDRLRLPQAVASTRGVAAELAEASLQQAETARRMIEALPASLYPDAVAAFRAARPLDVVLFSGREVAYLDELKRSLEEIGEASFAGSGLRRASEIAETEGLLGAGPDAIDADELFSRLLFVSDRPLDRVFRRIFGGGAVDATLAAQMLLTLDSARHYRASGLRPDGSPLLRAMMQLTELEEEAEAEGSVSPRKAAAAVQWIKSTILEGYVRAMRGAGEAAELARRAAKFGKKVRKAFNWKTAERLGIAVTILAPLIQGAVGLIDSETSKPADMAGLSRQLEEMKDELRGLRMDLREERARRPAGPAAATARVPEAAQPRGPPAVVVKTADVTLEPRADAAVKDRLAVGERVVIVGRIRMWVKIGYHNPATGTAYEGWVRPGKIRSRSVAAEPPSERRYR